MEIKILSVKIQLNHYIDSRCTLTIFIHEMTPWVMRSLRVGLFPKYYCFAVTCPQNLCNVPELISHV